MNLQDILGRIGFDWQVAFANLINFLIIFLILRYFAWKPLQDIIRARKEKIQQGLDDAQKAMTQLAHAEAERIKVLDKAKEEANHLVASAQDRIHALLEKSEQDALSEKNRIIAEGYKANEKERMRAMLDIRAQSADLIVSGVTKIIEESLTPKEKEKITERALIMMRSSS